ncbi:MAG: leucine--tRNA ligase, partial [Anaerolineae bacterium]
GHTASVHLQAWPQWDETLAAEEKITIVVQINGKVRDRFTAPVDVTAADAIAAAKTLDGVIRHTQGKPIVKEIYVPGKLVNLVTG